MLNKEVLREASLKAPATPGIAALLSVDSPLLHYVGEVENQIIAHQQRLGNENLATDEGRFKAIKLQGTIIGLKLASEILFDLAESEQPEEKSNA